MEKKTALYEKHLACGGKMVAFGGYLMPVQYPTGVIAEHKAVRTAAGLFDVSHMGELLLSGQGALPFLQQLLTNNMEGMADGDCRYSPMCNERGGVVDDLIVYRYNKHLYLLVVNAANHHKDVDWIRNLLPTDVNLTDNSEHLSELALQGPKAQAIMAKVAEGVALPVQPYTFVDKVMVAGIECLVSRTGYTGEDGFEVYCAAEKGPELWDALLAAGEVDGLIPCGLGARDTLRLEAGMPLYGHEMNDVITPKEAALSFFVKLDKPDFIGKTALVQRGEPTRRRTGLKMVGRGIAREGCTVYSKGEKIGVVTSGTQLPYVGYAGAMALLQEEYRQPGTLVVVEVRGRRIEAVVVKLPFYKRAEV